MRGPQQSTLKELFTFFTQNRVWILGVLELVCGNYQGFGSLGFGCFFLENQSVAK